MFTKNSNINKAYEYCVKLTQKRESNFSLGFSYLPERKRLAIYVVYAVCRYLDDVSDEDKGQDPSKLLNLWRRALDEVYTEKKAAHPIGVALIDLLKTYVIPKEGFLDLIAGCEQDQKKKVYKTFDELKVYCEFVATSIAKLTLPVYGAEDSQEVFEYARDLSFAFQLTNILRDVSEDLGRKRCYLPSDELDQHNLKTEDFLRKEKTQELLKFYEFFGKRCEDYFIGGSKVIKHLDQDSQKCVDVMFKAYHRILEKILADPIRSLDSQVILDQKDKFQITGDSKFLS